MKKRCFQSSYHWFGQSDQWQVLYQVRSESISQPGEVSFPGGGVEEGETPQQAAVREAVEELNIQSEQIDILGEIDFWSLSARPFIAL